VINQANASVTVTSSASPLVFGQTVTFAATVAAIAPASGTPTGNVTFVIDGSNQTPVATLNGSGVATFTISTPPQHARPHPALHRS